MTSWRDSASSTAQDDLDALLNASLDLGQDLLGKNGAFFPFGCAVTPDQEVTLVAADPGLGEHPSSLEVLKALVDGLRSDRERLRAAALVSDVTLTGAGDAIRVELEHREGVVLEVHVPYRRSRFRNKVAFGDMSVSYGDRTIWVE